MSRLDSLMGVYSRGALSNRPLVQLGAVSHVASVPQPLLESLGATRAVGVLLGYNALVVVDVVQQIGENLPGNVQLVVSHKVGVVALEAVENQRLVGLGDSHVRVSAVVGQIEIGDNVLGGETGQLGVHLHVDRLGGLDSDNQLVSRQVVDDTLGDISELHSDLHLTLVESLTGSQNEGNTLPSVVVDLQMQSGEGNGSRVVGNTLIVSVAGLLAVLRRTVLAENDVINVKHIDTSQDLDLLISNVLSAESDGSLHGENGENLQQMVLHHISDDTNVVEVATSALSAERLLEGDLHVGNVVLVPHGGQELVAEPQNVQVLDHLLTEVVIDSEDLRLLPQGSQALLQLS